MEKLKEFIEQRFSVVQKTSHKFEPQGETIVFVLSESHFSVHTYPEHNYLTLDIYICNMSIDMIKVREDIIALCSPVKVNHTLLERGSIGGISKL